MQLFLQLIVRFSQQMLGLSLVLFHLLPPLNRFLESVDFEDELVDQHLEGAVLWEGGILGTLSCGLGLVELLHGEHAAESFLERHVGALLGS